MGNIKTLKEIENNCWNCDKCKPEDDVETYHWHKNREIILPCILKELKVEAIKWIKSLDEDMEKIRKSPELYNDLKMHEQQCGQIPEVFLRTQHQILWIKHFFNITEEDLK